MCVEGKCQEDTEKLRAFFETKTDKYTWSEMKLFPWPRGAYYGDEVKTYCDK